ncbi:MAG: hypothetical protein GX030_02250 [Firmicutes bacterium]|nr:hypothetical protein [Bacillota bacterium]
MIISGSRTASAMTDVTTTVQKQDREPVKELDKNAFLELLTVQLRYQDPMSPMSDQDFIAQMAQFSSLEQTQNLAEAMNRFTDSYMRISAVSQASSLLGREVQAVDPETGSTITGTVTRVTFIDGEPQLHLEKHVISMRDITSVV